MFKVELSVPASVNVLLTDNVFPFVMVSVPVDEVIVRPLILVAIAAPRVGVTSVGDLANTNAPLPVSLEITPNSCKEVVAAKNERLSEAVAAASTAQLVSLGEQEGSKVSQAVYSLVGGVARAYMANENRPANKIPVKMETVIDLK